MRLERPLVLGYLLLGAIFVTGIAIGLGVWDSITLPFANPWHVVGPLTVARYNPANNIVRVACVVLAPSLLLALVYLSNLAGVRKLFSPGEPARESLGKPMSGRARTVLAIGLVVISAVAALNIATEVATGPFDDFHEGEALGPAMSYERGQVPYRDFVVAHGILQDPGRAVLAFKLFGRSIGSVRAFWSLVKVLVFALVAVLALVIFAGDYRRAYVLFLAYVFMHFVLVSVGKDGPGPLAFTTNRSSAAFAFLIAILLVYGKVRGGQLLGRAPAAACFAAGFIPVAALAFSADVGVYLTASWVVLLAVLYLVYVRAMPRREQGRFVGWSLAGAVAGSLVIAYLVRGDLAAFARYCFVIQPKAFNLAFGLPYRGDEPAWCLVLALVAGALYWALLAYIGECRRTGEAARSAPARFVDRYFVEFAMLVVALIMFRGAMYRSDWIHVAIGASLFWLLALTVLIRHYLPRLVSSEQRSRAFSWVLALAVAAGLFWGGQRIADWGLIEQNFPVSVPDSEFIPSYHRAAIRFLRANLHGRESFYTLTSEGCWYYYIDRPPPSRLPILMYASADFFQRQLTRDLARGNVRYILFDNNYYTSDPDDIPKEIRFPIVVAWVQKHYRFLRYIDDNQIWVKK